MPALPRPDLDLGALRSFAEHARIIEAKPPSPAPPPVTTMLSHRPPVSQGTELGRLAEALPGVTLLGRYAIEHTLGRGSMGIVFAAKDLVAGRDVAIKLLDPELSRDPATVARFRAEAMAPRRIATPHVVEVLAADVSPDLVAITSPTDPFAPPVPYLVMERLVGSDVRQLLLEGGSIRGARVSILLGGVAPTIDRAHALGIVHRDLKPANLFVAKREDGIERLVVLDFGVAELADAGAARGLGGGLFGTPWYMSPEQAEGGIATPASDRWALAVIAFRMLTGESYWTPAPVPELLARIVAGPTDKPSRVIEERRYYSKNVLGPAFDAWFMKACARSAEDRFSSAVEQMAALADALDRDSPRAP
jgi:serine/threonine-protein kinase